MEKETYYLRNKERIVKRRSSPEFLEKRRNQYKENPTKARNRSIDYYHKHKRKISNRKTSEEFRAKAREKYHLNKEKISERVKAYRKNNAEMMHARDLKLRQNPRRIHETYKFGAIRRKRDFPLTIEDVDEITKLPCIYCGLNNGLRVGIDRKDNSIGYVKSNCVPCCKICNKMKFNQTVDDFIKKCTEISNHNIQL